MFVTEDAQAGRDEQKKPASRRFEPQPASGEHPQEMPAGKQQHITVNSADALDHAIRPRANLCW